MLMRALLTVLALASSSCGVLGGLERQGARSELASRWHYEVRTDAELTELTARVCFEGAVPVELRAGKDEAAGQLKRARWLSPGAVRRLPVVDGRIQLEAGARDGCMEYEIELADRAGSEGMLRRVGQDLVASPNVWLWRPEQRASNARATLAMKLPEPLSAVLPWPERQGVYELDAQAFRFDSYAAFGELEPLRLEHGGVPIEAAVLDGALRLPREGLERWLRKAVDIVSIGGRFPARSLRVLLVPTEASRDPVAFGMVSRGGSGSVLLFVAENASEDALVRDWVLPHELGHLWLPFVEREEAWLSEGLATYLQEVLRVRAGVLSVTEGLLGMARGMRSARDEGTGRAMREESRDMHHTAAYRSVYWAGAAYFLMADVALRRESDGQKSLPGVLLALRDSADYGRTWQAAALLARLDQLAGQPVFAPLASACLTRTFPDVEPTLAALGIREGELEPEAPLASIRQQLVSKP
jgi:hypothetical protein